MAELPSNVTQYPVRNTAHMTDHMIPGTFQVNLSINRPIFAVEISSLADLGEWTLSVV